MEGCYAEGPNKFGFGISTSFNNGKLLIGSLKDYVHLVEFADGITLSTVIPNPIDHDHNDHNHKSDDSSTTTDYHKFGESVYVGDKNLYVAALNYDNGKGKVFVYPFEDNFAKSDENAWTDPIELQPNDVLDLSLIHI